MAKKPESRIVSGVAQFSSSGALGPKTNRAQVIEEAMSEAVLIALREGHGIEDSETILAYKRFARAAALQAMGENVDLPPRPEPKKK